MQSSVRGVAHVAALLQLAITGEAHLPAALMRTVVTLGCLPSTHHVGFMLPTRRPARLGRGGGSSSDGRVPRGRVPLRGAAGEGRRVRSRGALARWWQQQQQQRRR